MPEETSMVKDPQPQTGAAAPGARVALLLLLAINLFNYIDRMVLAAVEPDIRRELLLSTDPNDPNAKAKMGLLSTAFVVTFMLASPVFGLMAGHFNRWLIIAVGVALWSLASGASGLATTFTTLLLTRCFVGIGEAAYGPVAPTVICDYYPVARRGQVLSWFYLALPVGGALGFTLGGQVAASSLGWRWAFYLVVPPGLLLGLLALFMREPARGAADVSSTPPRRPRPRDYLVLLRTPSYVLNTLGMTAMTFAIGGVAYWMPEYLHSRAVKPLWGIEPRSLFGIITALAGFPATLAGGIAGDALRRRFPGSYFLVSAAGMILGVPCFLLMLYTPFPLAWLFVFLAVFWLFFNTGPSNAILANVTHPAVRASAFALNILIIHAFGDVLSPPLIGWIADRWSLTAGFVVVSAFMFLGGLIWLAGAPYLQRDTAAAPHSLAAG
jgi:MFS family permease